MSIMAWSQQTLPMMNEHLHMVSSPAYVDVNTEQFGSLDDQPVQLKPSSVSARMDARQISSHPDVELLGPFVAMPNSMMPQQLSLSHGEIQEQKLFPRVEEDWEAALVSQQLSLKSKQTSHKEPWPKVLTLSSSQKGATQTKSQNLNSNTVRLQKSSSSKSKRVTHTEPPPKDTTESFESIRSKMRESLTASLALVCNDQIKSEAEEQNLSVNSSMPEVAMNDENGQIGSLTIINSAPCYDLELHSRAYEHSVQKYESAGGSSIAASTDEFATYDSEMLKCDAMHALQNEKCETIMEDELLLQNGLVWSSCVDRVEGEVEENPDCKTRKSTDDLVNRQFSGSSRTLATKIEAELFRLFAGVNKKYKEKGRSLLFNLRDQNNPELRKRVVSGEIAPERLCSMTAAELASKELSDWRIAKAEELAQMVVLPDTDLDLKRLVKKTHKGEIQVEVEQGDDVSVEVEVGANSLPLGRNRKRKGDLEPQPASSSKAKRSDSKSNETGSETTVVSPDKNNLGEDSLSTLLRDSTDYMQDVMVGEFRDAESLPPVPTLDEFMRDLDSQPPFGDLSAETMQDGTISDESKSDCSLINVDTEPGTPKSKLDATEKILESKSIPLQDRSKTSPFENANTLNKADSLTTDVIPSNTNQKLAETLSNAQRGASPIKKIPKTNKHLWDGLIQLNITSLVTVLGYYKSGKQTSVENWPGFLEIKGRVRLDAFEKFLQELGLSRSRGIMIMQFVWKKGSPESGRSKLRETIDSYIADERVGFAEPASGVELYFCPPHPKTSQVLVDNLPKGQVDDVAISIDDGLVGVVVWRRPSTGCSLSRSLHPNQNHGSHETPPLSRTGLNSKADGSSVVYFHISAEEDDDDIPPGFGPVASRADDDLPEFNFVTPPRAHPTSSKAVVAAGLSPPTVRPPPVRSVEQIRQMIHKYGQQDQSASRPEIGIEAWADDDDDDDIPEWRPNRLNRYRPQLNPQSQNFHQHNTVSRQQQHGRHSMRPPATAFPYRGPESGRRRRPPVPGSRGYDGTMRQQHEGPRGFVHRKNRSER